LITTLVPDCYIVSLLVSIPFSQCFSLFLPSTCRPDGWYWYLSHQHFPEVYM